MTHVQRVAAAQEFVQRWKGRGYEKGDTHTFWLDLLTNVFGMDDVTTMCCLNKPQYLGATLTPLWWTLKRLSNKSR